MDHIYALIQSGIVVNTIIADPSDPEDPSYLWVDITSVTPQPGIGWSYNGSTFTPPAAPPIDWSVILENDIDNIQSAYLQALSDYQAAQAAGSQSDADSGIAAGISDSESSYTTNEATPFTQFIALISSGG